MWTVTGLTLGKAALVPVSSLPTSIPYRNSKPRNRPSFRQILLHLDIASADVLSTPQETYFKSQVCCGWKNNGCLTLTNMAEPLIGQEI